MYEMQQNLLAAAKQRVHELMEMEKRKTWTQNDHYLTASMSQFEQLLMEELNKSSAASSAAGYEKQQVEIDQQLVRLIAGTLAYFKVCF